MIHIKNLFRMKAIDMQDCIWVIIYRIPQNGHFDKLR